MVRKKKPITEVQDLAVLSKNIPGLEIFLIDEDMRVRCKVGHETFIQRWHDELVEDAGFLNYFSPETKTIIEPLLRVAFQQTPVSSEFSINNNSFSIRIFPYKNERDEDLYAVILQNITETKIVENTLKSLKKEAEEANRLCRCC